MKTFFLVVYLMSGDAAIDKQAFAYEDQAACIASQQVYQDVSPDFMTACVSQSDYEARFLDSVMAFRN